MKTKSESVPALLPEEKIQLRLQRYLELCRQNVAQTDEAAKWLRKHGLEDLSLFELYSIGWSDGSLGDKLPNDPKVREELRHIGLLGPKDRELFEGHALFTVFGGDGRIQNIWAVGADGPGKFLPNRPRGPWNLPVTKHSRHVFVVADPLSALVLVAARFASVLAVDPDSGVVDVDLLKARGVQRVSIIAGDTPEASKSARVLVARFSGIPSDVAVLTGTSGVREFLKQHGASELSQAVTVACAGMQGADIPNFLPTPDGFRIRIETREYFAIRLMRSGHQLKTTLRAHCRGRIHVDTLDLYGSRARKEFIREAARIFEEPPCNLEEDLAKLLAAAERRAAQPDLAPPDEPVDPVPEALRKEAEVFGQSADLVARIRDHLTTLGVEGEDINKTVAYLGMTSRLLTQPLAIKIWGSFGTGKSAVMQGVAGLCPPEHHFPISYLSAKALLHMERHAVKGKFMTVAEAKGAEDSAYLLRELISSGRLIGRFTDRDSSSGKLYTKTTEVEGPTAVMVTDADVDPDEETGSRFIVLCSDESRSQTQRILQRQRAQQALAGLHESVEARRVRDLHHAFQRLLQPLTVVIPEGLEVPESDDRISSRRDWPKIANLMKAMALLRQMQKAVKQEGATNYIEVDSEDVRLTLPLIDAVFRKPMRELSDTSRNLIQAIHELRRTAVSADAPLEAYTFSMRQVREHTRLPQTTLHRCKGELMRYELLVRAADNRQRPFRYWLDWAASPDRSEEGDST